MVRISRRLLLNASILACIVSSAHQCVAAPRFTFGVLSPLSGSFAVFGESNRCGVDGAIKNTQPNFDIVYGDSRGESAPAVAEYKRLTGQYKDVFMFVQRSTAGMAVNSLSARDKIPLFGGLGHPKFAPSNPSAWQFWVSSDDEGGAIAKAALKRNLKRMAVLTVDDEWSVTVSNGFREAFIKGGGTIVRDDSVLPTDPDIKPLLLKAAKVKADGLFLNVNISQLGVGIKQARDLGLSYPIYSTFWCSTPDVLNTAGAAANGVTFVEMETDLPKFKKDVADCSPNPPSSAVLSTYAATKFALQVLEANPTLQNIDEFHAALERETEVRLPDLSLAIINRQVKFPIVVKEINDGKPQPIEE